MPRAMFPPPTPQIHALDVAFWISPNRLSSPSPTELLALSLSLAELIPLVSSPFPPLGAHVLGCVFGAWKRLIRVRWQASRRCSWRATVPERRKTAGRRRTPWKKPEPLDWRSKAKNRRYPFAAKLHKESQKLFSFYSAVLGGLRRVRFLRLKTYSRSA